MHTLRFTPFHRAAQLLRPQGTAVLRLTDHAATRHSFTTITRALARTQGNRILILRAHNDAE